MQITKIFTTIAVWGALEVALFVVAVPATTPASVRTERPFVLTFWCGPPLSEFDDARAAEIAAAGFNVVGPPCEGPVNRAANLRALDVAQRHGLRMWIRDRRFDTRAPPNAPTGKRGSPQPLLIITSIRPWMGTSSETNRRPRGSPQRLRS